MSRAFGQSIVEQGPPTQIRANSKQDRTRAFLEQALQRRTNKPREKKP